MRKATPLRDTRRARTISQEQMARLLEISQQTYSKYENGLLTPPVPVKARIAAILGVAVDDIWPVEVAK